MSGIFVKRFSQTLAHSAKISMLLILYLCADLKRQKKIQASMANVLL
ncbi:hypothetical protein B4144_4066 [Bacillus atrophaeus]|nr:hypothetical protein B4144_4066 [Bacillus atrophaeus]